MEERTSLRKGSEPRGIDRFGKGESHFGVDIGGKIRTRRTASVFLAVEGQWPSRNPVGRDPDRSRYDKVEMPIL